jgi:O-antigen ligase
MGHGNRGRAGKNKMKRPWTRKFYRPGLIDHKTEFLVILSWMLFFPIKDAFSYFLGTALMIGFIAIRNIYFMKTFAISSFNLFLGVAGLGFIVSVFFSNYYLESLELLADMILIFIYFILFYKEQRKETDQFLVISYIISVFSGLTVTGYILPFSIWRTGQRTVFFASSIHEGIISGMGVLILLYYVLNSPDNSPDKDTFSDTNMNAGRHAHVHVHWKFYLLLVLNMAGVFVSQSKAAYLGTVVFALLLLLLRKKKWLPWLALFVALTFIIPNPIRSMVIRSLTTDPYAANRIDIWKMCARMFKDYPLTGVGLDNFSEVSPRYNFKQPRGPANYNKVPHYTHNDYFKLTVETGIAGLALLILLFYSLARKLFSSSMFNITKVLILYLLFQAFLFNILFTTFFLFIFLYLLKTLLEGEVTFRSFSLPLKFSFVSLLLLMTLSAYILPWWSDGVQKRAGKAANLIEEYQLLTGAGVLNPLDANVYLRKAAALNRFFQRTSNWEAFYDALSHLRRARRLRTHFLESYLMEARLYMGLLSKRLKYENMEKEIIAALEQAETHAPFNPFIKLTKAFIYLEFDQMEKAKEQALRAINLEPEYIAALFFLKKHFNYFPDEEAFKQKISAIVKKRKEWQPLPGDYLYQLYQVPGEVAEPVR